MPRFFTLLRGGLRAKRSRSPAKAGSRFRRGHGLALLWSVDTASRLELAGVARVERKRSPGHWQSQPRPGHRAARSAQATALHQRASKGRKACQG